MFVLCLVLRRRNWQISWYCRGLLTLFAWAGVYREMRRRERKKRKKEGEKEDRFSSLTVASIKPSKMYKCFCVYLPHGLVLLQPWHSGRCHKMAACASNNPFKERRGEGAGWGGGREKNKCHAMQTVKRVQSALQQFYSTSWAEPHWLPADKSSLISGLLAAASPALCHPRWLLHFLNHHPLWAPCGCKQMQFCISCSLDTTEAELQQCSLIVCGGKQMFYNCKSTEMIKI